MLYPTELHDHGGILWEKFALGKASARYRARDWTLLDFISAHILDNFEESWVEDAVCGEHVFEFWI